MDRKEFVNKIKTMFSEVEAEVVADIPAEEEFKDVTTIDGVILRTSDAGLVEGEKVLVISSEEEGAETEADAPEGEYTVEGKVV
jgi:F0F1-type ATP synthase gamma subunit